VNSETLLTEEGESRPLWLLSDVDLPAWLAVQPAAVVSWVRAHNFQAERHRVLAIPGAQGNIASAIVGLGSLRDPNALTLWHAAGLADRLPAGHYSLATPLAPVAATHFVLGWLVGAYRLTRYRNPAASQRATLAPPKGADLEYATAVAAATSMARDLINTPANDLGPEELAQSASDLAQQFGAKIRIVMGEELVRGYPLIHAVGMGSPRAPRLIDLRWGNANAPRVTIVGKGVCFDSGGLDIKPSASMLLMKNDMGGAACALALAHLLMRLGAPIQLRVLIPAVENSVDGLSFRPGDVLRSKKGLTVEIGNTDAEGRLVLADALAEADAEKPALLIDLATLTGAARVALGPELPPIYSPDESLVNQLKACGDSEADYLWPLPLWPGYDDELTSKIADLGNVSASSFAGSIIGALFLKRFVTATPQWLHLDIFGWNSKDRPGRPVGAEAQGVRALYRLIRARFG
jgi:leucyl aminopeptidase